MLITDAEHKSKQIEPMLLQNTTCPSKYSEPKNTAI